MDVEIVCGIEGASRARGPVVIVDIIRACTTAAYAFSCGITEIELVATVKEALARPGFKMGEAGGRLIPGFDHNNSPSKLMGLKLSGRAVMRTGSGVQCAVAAKNAETLWLGSLVVAQATAKALAGKDRVTLVAAGAHPGDANHEDIAGAIYLKALLNKEPPLYEKVISMIRNAHYASNFRAGDSDWPIEDIDCCVSIDAFDFAMRVAGENGALVTRPWK